MNVFAKSAFRANAGVEIVEDEEALDAFLRPECAAAIWQRKMPEGVRDWLAGLEPDLLPNGRVILPPHAVGTTVQHLCDMSKLPAGIEREWLEQDIAHLAEVFSGLMAPRFIRLRLDVVTTNACRKFHVDAIRGRLICTYRGTGTQYGRSDGGSDPTRVFSVPTGAPVLLRGTLWPPQPCRGLLHRSPPIEGSGETRLLLVLDPIYDLDED